MCKLVQMVTHADQYERITNEEWRDKMMTAFGMEREGADALLNISRRLANRILAQYAD